MTEIDPISVPGSAVRETSAMIVGVIQRVADKIGAILLVEPEWGCVGQLTYKSGIRRYFRLSTLVLIQQFHVFPVDKLSVAGKAGDFVKDTGLSQLL